MIDLSDAPVIDTHLHGWRTSELLDAQPAGFAERVTMLGMCVLTSGGDPVMFSDVLARATASTPLALALLARLGEHLGARDLRLDRVAHRVGELVGTRRLSLTALRAAGRGGHERGRPALVPALAFPPGVACGS